MLLLTLRGPPTLYYGDELGLENVAIPPDRVQDPWEKNEPGLGLGRDPARTPMPWDGSPNAGFTTGLPWLPLNPDHATRNVDICQHDPESILSLYHRLIALRRDEPALYAGRYVAIETDDEVFVFERHHQDTRLLIALNFAKVPQSAKLPVDGEGRVLLSTHLDREGEALRGTLILRPS